MPTLINVSDGPYRLCASVSSRSNAPNPSRIVYLSAVLQLL